MVSKLVYPVCTWYKCSGNLYTKIHNPKSHGKKKKHPKPEKKEKKTNRQDE